MKRLLSASALALALCLASAALPAHAEQQSTSVSIAKPAAGTPILVVLPEVSLGLLTAAGSTEPKEEWSKSAQQYLAAGMAKSLEEKSYKTSSVDLNTYEDPRALQMLKLNDAVTASIAMNTGLLTKLPTKTSFEWTLGDGAASLAPTNADPAAPPAYALFLECQGSYSSGGRAAMMIGMAALGVGIPTGGQYMRGTLVDLKTGQVVWYDFIMVAPGTDIRTAEGAASTVNSLFKKLPL